MSREVKQVEFKELSISSDGETTTIVVDGVDVSSRTGLIRFEHDTANTNQIVLYMARHEKPASGN